MSRKRILEILSSDGNNYGQIVHPSDSTLGQKYAHDHVDNVTKDFLLSPNTVEIADCGFGFSAMSFAVADGRIYKDGKQFDVAFSNNQLVAANANHPRIDLVVATLSEETPSDVQFVPFRRLRTPAQIEANTPQYPQTQFQRATELRNIAVISIKTGLPAATPIAPPLGANEIALCSITVPANGTAIEPNWLTDLRNRVTNLASLNDDVDLLKQQIITALNYENQPRNFLASFQRVDTLNSILNQIAQGLLVLRYRYPTIATSNGYLPAEVLQVGSQWVVDIPIGVFIQFGDRYVSIVPENFDPTLNARYATSSAASELEYTHIFDNQSEIEDSIQSASANPAANVVRFDVPVGPINKALIIDRDGQIELSDSITPSNANFCLLAKITSANSVVKPSLKTYYNVRNGIVGYSGIYNAADPSTKQFEWVAGTPPGVGYLEYYAVRNADNVHYDVNGLSIPVSDFDKKITLNGIADGDRWVVRHLILSTI